MAEEKKKGQYSFGSDKIDLEQYLKAAESAVNMLGYGDYKGWNQDLKAEFAGTFKRYADALKKQLESGEERFITDGFGTINDATNELNGDIPMAKEVASYLNTIGKAMIKKQGSSKKSGSKKFDISKNGFIHHWVNQITGGLGGKPNLAPYMNMDLFDETTGKRGRTNRAVYLAGEIDEYRDSLSEDYDFSDTPFKSLQGYKDVLTTLSLSLRDKPEWTDEDLIALQKAGISSDFYNDFFTEKKDWENPNAKEETDLEKLVREKEEASKKRDHEEELAEKNYNLDRDLFFDNYRRDNPFTSSLTGNTLKHNYDKDDVLKDIRKLARDDSDVAELEAVKQYIDFGKLAQQLRTGKIENLLDLSNKLFLGSEYNLYTHALDDGYYVMPGSENYDNWSFLAYNPMTGHYEDRSMLLNELLREAMAYKEYGKRNPRKHLTGGMLEYSKKERAERLAKEAADIKERGKEVVEAGKRKPSEDFSATDYARLAAIGVDLVGLVASFVPGAGNLIGAGTGVASSLANFGADWAEDGFQWSDAGNLLVGLGASAVGLIPGLGTAGKAGMITRNLVKFAPRIMVALQAKNALSEEARASWLKIISDEKLTVDDWRNIANGVSAVAGVGRMSAALLKANAMRNRAATGKQTIITDSGKLLIGSETEIQAIKNAKNPEEATKLLQKLEGGKDEKISSLGKWYNPFDNGLVIRDHYDYSKLQGTGFDGKGISDRSIWQGARQANGFPGINIANPYNKIGAKVAAVTTKSKSIDLNKIKKAALKRGSYTDKEVALYNKKLLEYGQLPLTKEQLNARLKGKSQATNSDEYTPITSRYKENQSRIKENYSRVRAQREADEEIRAWKEEYKEALTPSLVKQMKQAEELHRKLSEAGKKGAEARKLKTELKNKANAIRSVVPSLKGKSDEEVVEAIRRHLIKQNAGKLAQKTKVENTAIKREEDRINLENSALKAIEEANARIQNEAYYLDRDDFVFKLGGTLDLSKIRRANKGMKTNTTSTADWYNDIFNSDEMLNWFNSVISGKTDYTTGFNHLQTSWKDNLDRTGYTPGQQKISYDQGVYDRQGVWNNTGVNAAIGRLLGNKIMAVGNTGDNASSGYRDGFFGSLEYLRHGGTEESWKGRETELKTFQDKMKASGWSYELDPSNGMYYLSPIKAAENALTEEKPATVRSANGNTGVADETKPDPTKPTSSNWDAFRRKMNNPTLTHGLPRAIAATYANRKMTDMAVKAALDVFMKSPFLKSRAIESNLDAEMLGVRGEAELQNEAKRLGTADGALLAAANLEAKNKGLALVNAGKEASNLRLRETSELAWQQEKENAANRHETAMFNRAQQWSARQNIAKAKMAEESLKFNILDIFGLQLEYEDRTARLDKKTQEDAMARSDIHNAIMYTPNEVSPGLLDDDEMALWTRYINGEKASTMSADDLAALNKILSKISLAETILYSLHLGLTPSKWLGVRLAPKPAWGSNVYLPEKKEGGVISAKEGEKVKIERIKARSKDADRFIKSVREKIKEHKKEIARLLKTMNGIIKSKDIK